MASFKLILKDSVNKDIRKLPKFLIPKVATACENLAQDPFPAQSLKLIDSQKSYRIRVGDYRIIYQVDLKNRIILIEYISHRKDVYKKR